MSALDKLIRYLRHDTTTGFQLREMDAFRGWAVLGVLSLHLTAGGRWRYIYDNYGAPAKAVMWLLRQGWAGVDLFFFISGFLLYLRFGKAYYEGRPAPSVASFYKRRFLRIAPAYYSNIVLELVLVGLIYSRAISLDVKDLLLHASFLHNLSPGYSQTINGVLWSLAIEAQFYLVLPFMASWFFGRRWIISLPLILAASSLYKLWVIGLGDFPLYGGQVNVALTPFNGLIWRLDQFAVGICFANLWLYVTVGEDRYPALKGKKFAGLLFCMGIICVLGTFYFLNPRSFNAAQEKYVLLSPLLAAGFGMAVYGAIFSSLFKWIIANKLIEIVGIVSYSIFLWHNLLLGYLLHNYAGLGDGRPTGFLCLTGMVLAGSVIVGLVSYLALERPFLKKKPSRARVAEAVAS